MSDIEDLYFENENVLVFTNLDDLNQPYSCSDWGNRGVQLGGIPLITDDGAGSDLWGKFNSGSAFPSTVYIDHTMTVFYKANNPSLGTAQTKLAVIRYSNIPRGTSYLVPRTSYHVPRTTYLVPVFSYYRGTTCSI